MAEKAKKDNKNLIIGICAAVVVVIVIVIAAIFAIGGGTAKLDDSYFVSDDTKYVLTVDTEDPEADSEEYVPIKTHVVYTYSGDTITGMTTYAEYADETTAKAAYEAYKSANQEGVKSMSVNGKYLVVEMTEDNYADLTASNVKKQIELMETFKNTNLNDQTDEDHVEVDEIEEKNEE